MMKYNEHISESNLRKGTSGTLSMEAELLRKSFHFVAFALIFGYPELSRSRLLTFLVPFSLVLVVLEVHRVRSQIFANFLRRYLKFLLRTKELDSSIKKLHIIGSTWACWSFTILIILVPLRIAASCFAMFLIADGTAAIIGKLLGKHFWTNSKKTMEGSLAFFCAGLLMMSLFPDDVFYSGAIAVLIATVAEIPDGPFDDNFRVPLFAALAMFLADAAFL